MPAYRREHSREHARIKVVCGKDFIAIRAMEDYFTFHSVPLESLHLPNKSSEGGHQRCAVLRVQDHDWSTNVTIGCKKKRKTSPCQNPEVLVFCFFEKKNQISYSPSLQSEPQVIGNIVRNPVIKMNYTCVYPSIRTVSLPFPVILFSSELVMHLDERSTIHYSFDMFRFTAEPHDLYLHCTEHSLLCILATVVLPVAGVWILGFFIIILITVIKAGNRRLKLTGEQ
ncbi:uncharacterized protein LOC120812860 [Gasterosteus aculeatus]